MGARWEIISKEYSLLLGHYTHLFNSKNLWKLNLLGSLCSGMAAILESFRF